MRGASSRFISRTKAGNIPAVKALLTDRNNNSQWLDGRDFINGSVSFKNETSSDNSFDVGAVIISSFNFSLNNFRDKFEGYDFVGAQIDAYVGYTFEDETDEYIHMGHYYLVTHKTIGNVINCTAYDALALMDDNPAEITFSDSITVFDAVRQLTTARGITLANQSWPHSTYRISEADFPADAMTERQLLQYLIQICGCYARINSIGKLYVGWYGETPTETDPTTFSHSLYTSDVNITGVRLTGDEELDYLYGTAGYVVAISGNPFVNENTVTDIAANIGDNLLGLTFRPGSIDVLSSPLYEAGDVLSVCDAKGNRCTVYATGITYSLKLREQIRCGAEAEEINDLRQSSLNVHMERLKKEIYRNVSAYDNAYQSLANLLSSGMGLYETIEDAPGGGTIIYYHDRPILSESQIIWKATADAFGVSTDGGETWNSGITADGNILARVLTAIGVNADWIHTGLLADATGTNYWDLDRGVFRINSETAQQIAEYVDAASGWYFATPYTRDDDNVAHFRAFLKNGDSDITYNYEPYCYTWKARDDYSEWRVGVGYTLDYDLDQMPYGVSIICTFRQMGYSDLCTHEAEAILTDDGDGVLVLSDTTERGILRLIDDDGNPIITKDNYEIGVQGVIEAERFTVETDFTAGRKTAQLSVTVDGLISEVAEITEDQELISTRITQNANAIIAEASRASETETALSSRIQQTAQSISFTVTNPTESGNSATLQMSYTKEDGTTVSVGAQNITFSGMVKFVDLSGSNRGATVINGENISTGSIHDASNNTVFNLTDGSLTIKKGSITLGSTPSATAKGFKVESDGTMQASSATIWGTVHATAGEIGGLTLSGGKLYTNGKTSRNSATTGVYIASDGIALGNTASTSTRGFMVDNAGNVTVYGGSINAGSISGGTISGAVISGSNMTVGDGAANTAKLYINGTTGDVWAGNLNIMTTDGYPIGGWYQDYDITDNARKDGHYMRLLTGYGIHVGSYTDAYKTNAYSIFDGGVKFRENVYYYKSLVPSGSDRRIKHDIKPLQDAQRIIMGLSPISYRHNADNRLHHGFVAQDVQELIQDDWCIVVKDPSEDILYLSYQELIADLVSVVQQQERRIKTLELAV